MRQDPAVDKFWRRAASRQEAALAMEPVHALREQARAGRRHRGPRGQDGGRFRCVQETLLCQPQPKFAVLYRVQAP